MKIGRKIKQENKRVYRIKKKIKKKTAKKIGNKNALSLI